MFKIMSLQYSSKLDKSLLPYNDDKRGIDGRLTSAQTALMMQEETIRRNERERKVLSDKVTALERTVAAADSEKRQLQEKMAKLKTNEGKLEEDKKNLRVALDDAETRCTKLELFRRQLDGELQRVRLAMTDKETENQLFRPGGGGGCPGQSPYPHTREYQGQSLFVGLERTPNGVRFRMPSPTQQVNLINFQTARLGIPVVQVAPWKLNDALVHPSRALQNYALRDPSQSYQSVVGRPGSSPQMIAAVHQGIVQRQWHPPTNQHRYELFETMLMCGLKTYWKKYLAIYWLHIRGDEHESTLPSPLFENDARWHAEQVLVQHLRVQLSVTNSDRLRSITIMQNASPCSSCAKMYKEELESVMQSGVEISVVFSSFHQVSRLSCRELGHSHSFVCPLLHVDNASALRELRDAGFKLQTTRYQDWERLCSALRVPRPDYLVTEHHHRMSRRGQEDINLRRDLDNIYQNVLFV